MEQKNKRVYALHCEKNKTLKIEYRPVFQNQKDKLIDNNIFEYNDIYYLSLSRKALKQKALEIKEKWIKEQKEMLQQIENIEIK